MARSPKPKPEPFALNAFDTYSITMFAGPVAGPLPRVQMTLHAGSSEVGIVEFFEDGQTLKSSEIQQGRVVFSLPYHSLGDVIALIAASKYRRVRHAFGLGRFETSQTPFG